MSNQWFKVFPNAEELSGVQIAVESNVGLKNISVVDMIRADLLSRRAVLVSEKVKSIEFSSVNVFNQELIASRKVKIKQYDRIYLINDGEEIQGIDAEISSNDSELDIFVFLATPEIFFHPPKNKKPEAALLSQLVLVYIVRSDEPFSKLPLMRNRSLYESYSHLGFILADRHKFNNFLTNRYGSRRINLIEEFTTTELASDLFSAGLMVLCWGFTPWVYLITSQNSGSSEVIFPEAAPSLCTGDYIFEESIEVVSIIPGDDLKEWDTDNLKNWPILEVVGEGNVIQLDLFNLSLGMVDQYRLPPVPVFLARRMFKKISESNPIVSANILG